MIHEVRIRQLISLAGADLRSRWSGGIVSWGWMLAQPVAQIAVFTAVFSSIMVSRGARFPGPLTYAVYLCTGIFPWLAFSEGISRGATSLLEGAALLRRSPMPLAIFPLKSALAAWLVALVGLMVLLLIAPLLGVAPRATWALLPIPLLSLLGLTVGLSMCLSPIAVLLRDTNQLIHLVLPFIMWTAPIIYIADILPGWARSVQRFHPLNPALASMHGMILEGCLPARLEMILLFAYPAIAILAGCWCIRILDSEVRDAL